MTPEEKIREVLRNMVNNELPVQTLPAKVTKVDSDKGTCDVSFLDEDLADHYGVHLNSGLNNGTGLLIIPKIDSVVYISVVNNDPFWAYVSLYTDVDEIRLRGDQYKGLIKIDDLVDRLNNIENAFNDLLVEYKAHVHTGVTTGGGSTGTTTSLQDKIEETSNDMIENTKVKHG